MISNVSTNTQYKILNNTTSLTADKNKSDIHFSQCTTSEKTLKTTPVPTLLAYMTNKYADDNVLVEFFNTLPTDKMMQKYAQNARVCADNLAQRAGKKGQVLNWIDVLAKNQLKRIDEIYALADSLKSNGSKKLVVIGIGGSKHTIENMLRLNGKGENVYFLSAADPQSIKEFFERNNLKEEKPAVLVVSKSGTTLEPSYDFDCVRKILGDDFKNYVCITDADKTKSKLRQIAEENGYKCGIIHDDCGGRFGAFDDHSLAALAYCGMSKYEMKRMLEASLKAQKNFLNPDITKNRALQRAAFNAECILNGKQNQYDYYFGDRFDGTALWNTQLKKESHKSLYKPSGDLIAPAFLHNSTEADLDEGNTNSFYTFNTIKNDNSSDYKLYNALIKGSLKAYSDRHPVSLVSLKDLSIESIAEFIELKHFETIYTGMMIRAVLNKDSAPPEILPEVLQPHVNIYKNEVNKILDSTIKS